MKIQLLAFGIARDLLTTSSIELEVPNGSTVLNFKEFLANQFPSISSIQSFAIAVNEEYAQDSLIIQEKDVIAIIPPVSGG